MQADWIPQEQNYVLPCRSARLPCYVSMCRCELKVASLKVPKSQVGQSTVKISGMEWGVHQWQQEKREGGGKKKSGDGRNKYLKERLPSQLHRAEMWKRQSKQAWSLGWMGVLWGRKRKRGRKTEWECEHETKERDGASTGRGKKKEKERKR